MNKLQHTHWQSPDSMNGADSTHGHRKNEEGRMNGMNGTNGKWMELEYLENIEWNEWKMNGIRNFWGLWRLSVSRPSIIPGKHCLLGILMLLFQWNGRFWGNSSMERNGTTALYKELEKSLTSLYKAVVPLRSIEEFPQNLPFHWKSSIRMPSKQCSGGMHLPVIRMVAQTSLKCAFPLHFHWFHWNVRSFFLCLFLSLFFFSCDDICWGRWRFLQCCYYSRLCVMFIFLLPSGPFVYATATLLFCITKSST